MLPAGAVRDGSRAARGMVSEIRWGSQNPAAGVQDMTAQGSFGITPDVPR
jgi:hypothetical protein